MKFQRVEEPLRTSEKGNQYVQMRLTHLAPGAELQSLETGLPLTESDLASSVRTNFMLTEKGQGTIRQAIEATGGVWPQSGEIDENWIQDSLDGREVVVRLKTREYKGDWSNEVQRFVVAG